MFRKLGAKFKAEDQSIVWKAYSESEGDWTAQSLNLPKVMVVKKDIT